MYILYNVHVNACKCTCTLFHWNSFNDTVVVSCIIMLYNVQCTCTLHYPTETFLYSEKLISFFPLVFLTHLLLTPSLLLTPPILLTPPLLIT